MMQTNTNLSFGRWPQRAEDDGVWAEENICLENWLIALPSLPVLLAA
jgi:hypothetical protein